MRPLKSGANLGFLFFMVLVIFTGTVANATLTTQTDSYGNTAILDSATNLYWYPDPGLIGGHGYGTYPAIEAGINALNTSNYFGTTNWRLATLSEYETMNYNNAPTQVASSFVSTHSSWGSVSIDQGFYFCLPGGICFGNPPVNVSYNETHWYGILAETTSVSRQILTNGPFCGWPFPACHYETVYDPAHYAYDFYFRDYNPPTGLSNPPADFYGIQYAASRDANFVVYDDNNNPDSQYLYGAWVVGSPSNTEVPEPLTMYLLGLGLMGLAGVRRVKK